MAFKVAGSLAFKEAMKKSADWKDMILPGSFIPVLEEAGLILASK